MQTDLHTIKDLNLLQLYHDFTAAAQTLMLIFWTFIPS